MRSIFADERRSPIAVVSSPSPPSPSPPATSPAACLDMHISEASTRAFSHSRLSAALDARRSSWLPAPAVATTKTFSSSGPVRAEGSRPSAAMAGCRAERRWFLGSESYGSVRGPEKVWHRTISAVMSTRAERGRMRVPSVSGACMMSMSENRKPSRREACGRASLVHPRGRRSFVNAPSRSSVRDASTRSSRRKISRQMVRERFLRSVSPTERSTPTVTSLILPRARCSLSLTALTEWPRVSAVE